MPPEVEKNEPEDYMIEISYSHLKWYTDQHIWVVGSRTTRGAHAYGEVFRLAVCEYNSTKSKII